MAVPGGRATPDGLAAQARAPAAPPRPAGGTRRFTRTLRDRARHHELLDRRPVSAMRWRARRRSAAASAAGVVVGNTGLLLNNGDPARLLVSVSRQRELRARRADSAAQQLADDRAEGRQAGDGVRHARRRNHRPDRIPDARQRDRLPHAGAAGGRSTRGSSLDAKPNFYKPGAEIDGHDRASHAAGDDDRAEGNGTQTGGCPDRAASGGMQAIAWTRRRAR